VDPSAVMRRCLEELDVPRAQTFWGHVAPHLPQPQSEAEALACLHRARTEAQSIALGYRLYSHRWLEDRGLPSGLPDELKPKAERRDPRIASAVGIAVHSPHAEAVTEIRGAMEDAVLEAEADRKLEDAPHVKARMMEARAKVRKQLFG
jgi:hypothetical protein